MSHSDRAPESLAGRINHAERRLLERQRSIETHCALLGTHIHARMTSPALLGAAAGLGFLLGDRPRDTGSRHSWLRLMASSVPLIHTVFAAANPGLPARGPSASQPSGNPFAE